MYSVELVSQNKEQRVDLNGLVCLDFWVSIYRTN